MGSNVNELFDCKFKLLVFPNLEWGNAERSSRSRAIASVCGCCDELPATATFYADELGIITLDQQKQPTSANVV
jgi:hypothetical protein